MQQWFFAILQMFIEYESMKYKTTTFKMAVLYTNWGEVWFLSLSPPKEEEEEEEEEEAR